MTTPRFRCPVPDEWYRAYNRLLELAHAQGLAEPPKPLILNGWMFSSAAEKDRRWRDTVEWAFSNGGSQIVEGVSEFAEWEYDEPAYDPLDE